MLREKHNLITSELNTEKILFSKQPADVVSYDLNITQDLRDKGLAREIIRNIQEARKNLGCEYNEFVEVTLPSWPSSEEEYIKRRSLAQTLNVGETLQIKRLNAKG